MYFQFNDEVVNSVINSINKARKFIKIAVFQLHRKEVFDALSKRIKQNGLRVEIITLPTDSINKNVREQVEKRFEGLIEDGGVVHYLKWGVGDPSQTKTATARWYSFHGKFIVSDVEAIGLSANLIDSEELDALILYNDQHHIEMFKDMFERIKETFCINGEGRIREMIDTHANNPSLVEDIFDPPEGLDSDEIKSHWINGYPQSMVGKFNVIKPGLYLLPFDHKSFDLYEKVIENSIKRVYISTESFTDEDFVEYLISVKTRNQDLDIRIFTGGTSQDYSEKTSRMYKELIANGIEIRVPDDDLETHSKLLITDNLLLVSSINLNKINLGFDVSYGGIKVWRQNTETVTIEDNGDMINSAFDQYMEIWDTSVDVIQYYAAKLENYIRRILSRYNIPRSTSELKTQFGLVIVNNEVRHNQMTIEIAKLVSYMYEKFGKKTAKPECLYSALVLYNLKRREHTQKQLLDKFSNYGLDVKLAAILGQLILMNIIEEDQDVYRLKPM